MDGTIIVLIPNKKLSYTWTFHDVPGFPETTVSWELDEVGPNKTRVKLTHSDFTGKEKGLTSFESHDKGWNVELSKLAKYCKGE
jgi:uncharacterized protein YndB with AHSA1/START domain